MADRWWGMLDIPDAPAEWTRAVRLPMHDGGTYTAETGVVIDVGRLRIIFAAADFTPPEPLAQALRDYFDLKPDDDLTPRKEVNA
jgi:hypothetical protein